MLQTAGRVEREGLYHQAGLILRYEQRLRQGGNPSTPSRSFVVREPLRQTFDDCDQLLTTEPLVPSKTKQVLRSCDHRAARWRGA